jgi:hypothetical protein
MALSALVDAAIARVARLEPATDYFPRGVAAGNLFGGAAGIAFFLHEAARLRSPSLLGQAARWADRAEAWARRASPAEWEPLGVETRWGLLHGLGGVAYARILVSSSSGDDEGVVRGVEMLLEACAGVQRQETRATFLFEGAAGLLCAIRQLRPRVAAALGADLNQAGAAMWQFLAERLETPIGGRQGNRALGMAHGIAGELWAAIDWADRGPLPDVVRARLTELVALAQRDDQLALFSTYAGQPLDDYVHSFCNGMTGQTLLWTRLAARADEVDLRIGELTANALDRLGPAPGYTLCCGMAGQAAVHAVVARQTKGDIHRRRGLARIRRAAELAGVDHDREQALSLWHGPLGVATVALLRLARESHVPCLELPHFGPLAPASHENR